MRLALIALTFLTVVFVFRRQLETWSSSYGIGSVTHMLEGPWLLVMIMILAVSSAIWVASGRKA
jgi:hypothetical protein